MSFIKEVGVNDVVEFYTRLFRDPVESGFKESDAMKAAEFFTKYYNLLDKGADSEGDVIIIDDIGGAGGE